jgi:hypothetical protein
MKKTLKTGRKWSGSSKILKENNERSRIKYSSAVEVE